jgi:hypothetical protein
MALFVRVILTAVVSFVSDRFQALHALEVSMCERLEFSRLVFLICKAWIAYGTGYAKKMQKWLVTCWRRWRFGDTLSLAASRRKYLFWIVFNPVDTFPSTLVSALDLERVL